MLNIARRIAFMIPLVIVLILPATPAAAQATWTLVPSPNPNPSISVLQDVSVVSPTNVWAVGYYYSNSLAAYRTLAMRHDGTRWTVVSTPNGSTGYNQLDKVDATAANNVWALGTDQTNGALVERYDGTQWRLVTRPSIDARDLDVVSPTDVWAVGGIGSNAAVTRWNGSSWTIIPTVPGATQHLMRFEGVAALASDNVWAVGWDRDYSVSSRPVSTLIAHWNGSTWTRVPSPNSLTRNILNEVLALGAGDVWAVGVAQNVSGGISERSLALHWNGSAWSITSTPRAESDSDDQLQAVTAVSANSVWALGYYRSLAAGITEPLLLHWNGTQWAENPHPNTGASAVLFGASAATSGLVWAVGYNAPSGTNTTLTLRTTQG
jgi:hypothetical protein